MIKKIITICFVFLFIFTAFGFAYAKNKESVEIYGGMSVPGVGISIDASHDKKLDDFVPGYKVLNVAVVNDSFNIIPLDPKRDKWWIKTDGSKKYPVIADLRSKDAKAWKSVPENLRNLVSYPMAIPIGARQIIDLFVPNKINVEDFTELIISINSLKMTINVIARQ